MDKVALLTAAERSELFRESAARRGMSPAVIEKDFWVCWVLKQLFAEPSFNERIVFKGGTSLSKVRATDCPGTKSHGRGNERTKVSGATRRFDVTATSSRRDGSKRCPVRSVLPRTGIIRKPFSASTRLNVHKE